VKGEQTMSIPKICPMLAVSGPSHMSKCRENGCAWWDDLAGACCVASGAVSQKKTAQGAANTPDGKVEKVLSGSDSTSYDTKNEEEKQA